jgi:uncharacterized membrane protein YdbT with pleckstrin-like domain
MRGRKLKLVLFLIALLLVLLLLAAAGMVVRFATAALRTIGRGLRISRSVLATRSHSIVG